MSNATALDPTPIPPDHELVEKISYLEEQIRNLQRLQQTVQRNITLFESLIASSHDGITLTRLDGTIIRIVRSIAGYSPTELSGISILEIVHPDDREAMREVYARLTHGTACRIEHQVRILRADGTYLWAHATITDMIDNPAVQALVHNFRNITQLRGSEMVSAELEAVMRHAPFAVFSKSLAGDILTWNGGAEQMFGYLHHEIIGRSISVLVPPDLQSEEQKARAQVIQERAPTPKLRTMRVRKDGTQLPIELVLSPLITASGIQGIAHLSYALK